MIIKKEVGIISIIGIIIAVSTFGIKFYEFMEDNSEYDQKLTEKIRFSIELLQSKNCNNGQLIQKLEIAEIALLLNEDLVYAENIFNENKKELFECIMPNNIDKQELDRVINGTQSTIENKFMSNILGNISLVGISIAIVFGLVYLIMRLTNKVEEKDYWKTYNDKKKSDWEIYDEED